MTNLIASLLFCAAQPRQAWAASAAELKVYSPSIEYHEKELEWRSFFGGQGSNHEQGHAMSAG